MQIDNGQQLIIKFPFNNSLFIENKKILKWEFSTSILITAYDILRNDQLTTQLQRSGGTIREYLHDIGFNRNIEIFADTGIFALEFKKSMMENSKQSKMSTLNNSDIFMAYELIDPDYLVAPDEIITLKDDEKITLKKLNITENNLIETVERFKKDKIYATIQGIEYSDILRMGDNIKELGIKNAARGGLLPLRRNNAAFQRILVESETVARKSGIHKLHAFGMPGISSLYDIFIDNSYDSIDTSTIYYYTSDRKYINDKGELARVKDAYFKFCDCGYCHDLDKLKNYPQSGNFIINLFGHNATMINRFMSKLDTDPDYIKNIPRKYYPKKLVGKIIYPMIFTNAGDIRTYDRIINTSEIHNTRINSKINNFGKGILVISSCSASKKYRIRGQPDFFNLRSKDQRKAAIKEFADILLEGKELYCGWEHTAILRAIGVLKRKEKVDHFIISAGFGLLKDTDKIPPYDCTFSGRSISEIVKMGNNLELSNKLRKISGYRLVYIALSKDYLEACGGIDSFISMGDEIVTFGDESVNGSVFSYSTHEYRYMEQEGVNFNPDLNFTLRLKGDILMNFAKSNNSRFVDYWHSLIDCNCKSK